MPERTPWTLHNIGQDMLDTWRRICTDDGGDFQAQPEGEGKFTVSCTFPSAGAAPGPAAAATQPPPGAGAGAAGAMAAPVSPDLRHVDLDLLHPVVREKVKAVIADLEAENVPMKVFESYRTPERQRMLFGKGRSGGQVVDPATVVTHADAWQSYHQYGMAVDMVIDKAGMGMWETGGEADSYWEAYHRIAKKHGLEPLSFELPHVQLEDTSTAALLGGTYPAGGDESWSTNLNAAVLRWPGSPKPPVQPLDERPPLLTTAGDAAGIDWHALPAVTAAPFRRVNGGQEWRVDGHGVYTRDSGDPLRTPGPPKTCGRVVELYGPVIAAASRKHGVAPELIVMTIATETAIFRNDDFTGPRTFRWEAHVTVKETGDPDVDGVEKGDYSAGPMQVLSTTARWMNNVRGLGYDNATQLKWFTRKPSPLPRAGELGLYDGHICIDVGTAYIAHQSSQTGLNPILVAAAYNAGSLRPSGTNGWGLAVTGDHLDRAARWFGDACAVMATLGR